MSTVPPAPVRATVAIVTPVYNDWVSLDQLLAAIDTTLPAAEYRVDVFAVDDCSGTAPIPPALSGCIATVDVLRLAMNVGHQRAIAVGLVHAAGQGTEQGSGQGLGQGLGQGAHDIVVVMDADGEDTPAELKTLIEAFRRTPDRAIVAQRRKRSEALTFRIFYWLYRRAFRALTGQTIDFGNFSVLSPVHVERLVHNANIWNNLAATMVQARLALLRVPTARGKRYAGQSQMNLISLVTHGLGAISVFSDAVFVRILVFSSAMLAVALLATIGVVGVRLLSTLAVPGWTTNVLGFILLLCVQAVMLPIMITFLQLAGRASFQPGPREHARRLVERVTRLYGDGAPAASPAAGTETNA